MHDTLLKDSFFIAIMLTGLLCGASLDQSIKQLPARRRIGVKAYSEYGKAADLKNGVAWYAILGLGGAIFSIFTSVLALLYYSNEIIFLPLLLAGIFAICHSICTSQAAPTFFKTKKTNDEKELEKLFNKFEFIQIFRSAFIVLNFVSLLIAAWLVMKF